MEGMREAAGFVLFHGTGDRRRFLLLRNARHGTWSFPKGHLEEGEAPEAGARRELEEETGIRAIRIVPGWAGRMEYLVPPGRRPETKDGYGKVVHLFLAEAAGPEWERSGEHDDGGWMTAGEVEAKLGHADLRRVFAEARAHLAAAAGGRKV